MSQKVKYTDGNVTVAQRTFVNASPEAGQQQGRWYGGLSGTTLNLVVNRLYLVPFMLHRARRPSNLGVLVTTAGSTGAILRFGIYNDTEGTPTSVAVDASTYTAETTGLIQASIAKDLDPGMYWLGVVAQGSPTTTPTVRATTAPSPLVGMRDPTNVGVPGYYSSSTISSSLPALSAANPLDAATAPSVLIKM